MRKIIKIEPPAPRLPTRKRVAAYARVSVTRDRTEHSLSAQVSYYNAFIQRHPEWEYAGVYADLGQTGTSDKRGEWRRMLTDCEAGKIDIILTKSISRFARNTVDLLETVRRLRELGIEVRFEKENINSMSGDGELMLTILASFAQEESFSASENIKWRIRKDFQKGKQRSNQVYGYHWDGENYVIVPEEADIVRFIFAEYLAEKSPRVIAAALDARGVKSMYGSKIEQTSIFYMLRNEKYIGVVIMQKTFVDNHITKTKVKNNGELPRYVIENAHPAIIDREVFEAVQARLQERKVTSERTAFTGKILCEVCGRNFRRNIQSHKDKCVRIMTCANKMRGLPRDCDTVDIPESILESVTAEVLGISEYDASVFSAKIKQIVVPSKNVLIYHFYSGKTVTRKWKSTTVTSYAPQERQVKQSKRRGTRAVSDETRQRLRDATLSQYEQHPERRAADSERMKKYWSENPELAKIRNETMLAARAEKRGKGGHRP